MPTPAERCCATHSDDDGDGDGPGQGQGRARARRRGRELREAEARDWVRTLERKHSPRDEIAAQERADRKSVV